MRPKIVNTVIINFRKFELLWWTFQKQCSTIFHLEKSILINSLQFKTMSIVLTNKRTKIGTAFDVNTTVENKHIESTYNMLDQRVLNMWHCWDIEPRNREKSLRLIWQRFSCLLDEWIAKILKKKISRWLFEIINIISFDWEISWLFLKDILCMTEMIIKTNMLVGWFFMGSTVGI